jgi:RNA polymerase sigma-70 factor, ECF subfamily
MHAVCGRIKLVKNADTEFDSNLILRTAEGDESAFTMLYKRLSPALYGMAFRIMNDAKEAEDVLQEGFTYIWRKASSYDPARSSPFSWAVMIVRNKAIDRIRTRQRVDRLHEKVITEASFFPTRDDSSADEPQLHERRALVHAALQEIPAEQRQALELAFFSGLTHEEIAENLSTPLGTIKARIRRGLLRLREFVKDGL